MAPIRTEAAGTTLRWNSSSGEITNDGSSRDVKDSIEDLATDTTKIYELDPKTYVYKGGNPGMRHIGYIAEEVHELDTAFAAYNEPEGPPVGINWNGIQVYMLEEMKKLRDQNILLGQRISALESGGAQSTPLSSGEEAAPAAPAEAPAEAPAAPAAAPADAPAAPADAPVAPSE
jgi:hypothetical protein